MKPLYRAAVILAVALALVPVPRSRSQGSARIGGPLVDGSVTRARGCGSHLFIAYQQSYAQAQRLAGEAVIDGDVLQGKTDRDNFEHEGRMSFVDLATGAAIEVFIERALMNRSDYARASAKLCR